MSGASGPILVACGLRAEARIAEGAGTVVVAGGGDGARLEAALTRAAPGVRGILSFGVAGGLSPALRPGDIRVASGVAAPDGTLHPTHRAWSAALAGALGVPEAVVAGVDSPLAGVAAKKALHAATGAALVDMESHVAARVAARFGLPFAILRVVSDGADQALPHAATVGMRADGKVDLRAVLASLARDPRQLPALLRTARDARAAFVGLFRSRKMLNAAFGLVDLGDPLLDVP